MATVFYSKAYGGGGAEMIEGLPVLDLRKQSWENVSFDKSRVYIAVFNTHIAL